LKSARNRDLAGELGDQFVGKKGTRLWGAEKGVVGGGGS